MLKRILKKIIPKQMLQGYHKTLAHLAAARYGSPGNKLVVIGVTGTNGKSTTCNFIAHALEEGGYKVGMATTVNFRIAGKEWLNTSKMTMLGRFQLQKLLAQMVQKKCDIAIVETSSEGLVQGRSIGIAYDIAVFTNLTPEHIESHGSFENYKKAKGILFASLAGSPSKKLRGEDIPKTIVVNTSDPHSPYFASFKADRIIGFRCENQPQEFRGFKGEEILAEDIKLTPTGSSFRVGEQECSLNLPGEFNIENALATFAACAPFDILHQKIAKGLASIPGVPGRMERIDEGQSFTVIVDYAPEPASFTKLYDVLTTLHAKRIIHVFGSCGGGRDRARRPVLGNIAGQRADIVIITNEDPYDDNPMDIIREVAAGALEAGKIEGQNLFIEADRGDAIRKAVGIAQPNDVIVITGKGAEQAIMVANGKKIPWDDRRVVREVLRDAK